MPCISENYRTCPFANVEAHTTSILRILTKISMGCDSSTNVTVDDPVSRRVCALAAAVLEHNQMDYSDIMEDLDLEDIRSEKRLSVSLNFLKRCVEPTLNEHSLNWGRIIAVLGVYAEFCRRIADLNGCEADQAEITRNVVERYLVADFGEFLNTHIAKWIHLRGGWNQLVVDSRTMDSPSDCDDKGSSRMYKFMSYAVMGMGVGTLLGFMAIR